MLKTQTIEKLLTATHGNTDFDVHVTVNGSSILAISNSVFRQNLELIYNSWSTFVKGDTIQEQYSYLISTFALFTQENSHSFNRIYSSLYEQYNPVNDYKKTETTAFKNERTVDNGKTSTTTATNYESKTTYNSTVEDDTTTFDSTTLRPATKTTRGGDDTNTLNGELETVLSGTDTITDERLAADNIKTIEGYNQSPQEAIENEIRLRIYNDFTDIVVNEFARRYLFLLA